MKKPQRFLRVCGVSGLLIGLLAATVAPASAVPDEETDDTDDEPMRFWKTEAWRGGLRIGWIYPWVGNGDTDEESSPTGLERGPQVAGEKYSSRFGLPGLLWASAHLFFLTSLLSLESRGKAIEVGDHKWAVSNNPMDAAYRSAMNEPFSEVTKELQELLSRRLTAVMAGVKDGKTIARWAAGETPDIRGGEDKERRLRTAYQILHFLLATSDTPLVVKAWFMGLNPQLGDVSPAEAIREDRLKEAIEAARAFAAGG